MPNRIIREVGLTSRKLAAASDFGERLYWRLYQAVDDFGRFHGDPALILGRCFPLMTDRVSCQRVREGRDELARLYLIHLYRVLEDEYLEITKFGQRVRQARPKYPGPHDRDLRSIDSNPRSIDGQDPDVDVELPESRSTPSLSPPPDLRLVHRTETPSSPPAAPARADEPPCPECMTALRLLNELTCRTYDAAGRGMDRLHACHQRHGLQPVLAVIRDKVREWGTSEKMHRHLNPQTLFDFSRFDAYRNALLGPVGASEPQRCPGCLVGYLKPGERLCWPCRNPRLTVPVPSGPAPEKGA